MLDLTVPQIVAWTGFAIAVVGALATLITGVITALKVANLPLGIFEFFLRCEFHVFGPLVELVPSFCKVLVVGFE